VQELGLWHLNGRYRTVKDGRGRCQSSSCMEWEPDQGTKREGICLALGDEISQAIDSGSPVWITRQGATLSANAGLDTDSVQNRSEVYTIRWTNYESHRLPVYEFYWADESRVGKGWLGWLWGCWQLIVGLPRLGLRAVDDPNVKVSRLAHTFYAVAWIIVILRLLLNLSLTVCGRNCGEKRSRRCAIAENPDHVYLSLDIISSVSSSLFCCAPR